MIAFIIRTFTLFLLLMGMMFGFIFLYFGLPNDWGPLWELDYNELSLIAVIAITILTISMCISIWMGIIARSKESATTKYVKQLAEPEFTFKKLSGSPALKKALIETNDLIETQRKSLQRLTNEKAEANDNLIQERIIAERQRLARELHDSVSQQLFAASMLLSALTEQEEQKENPPSMLKQVEKIVQQAQLEMRALLLHLRPIALRNNTLAQGLTELIIELQQKVYFNIDYQIEEIKLTKAEEDHLFRIAQEALSNTLRHSKATEVELLLIARNNIAIFRIQDNGLGFNIEEDKSTSYGLKNIAERAVEIGCKYKIVSVPGEGTIVEVKVPLKQQDSGEVIVVKDELSKVEPVKDEDVLENGEASTVENSKNKDGE